MSMRTGHPRTVEIGDRVIMRQVTRVHYLNGSTFGHIQLGGVDTIVIAESVDTITGKEIHWSRARWSLAHPEYYQACIDASRETQY